MLINPNFILAQDEAVSSFTKKYPTFFKGSHNIIIKNAILSDGTYLLNSKKEKIFVNIEDGYYLEVYPNDEFVKAKINWISEYTYKLEIVSFKKKNFKYTVGSEFTSVITDVRDDEFSYRIKLNDKKTYNGKLLKIEKNSLLK